MMAGVLPRNKLRDSILHWQNLMMIRVIVVALYQKCTYCNYSFFVGISYLRKYLHYDTEGLNRARGEGSDLGWVFLL
jgi:hypothetical protein